MKTSAWAHYNGEYGNDGFYVWYRNYNNVNSKFAWFPTIEEFKHWYNRRLYVSKHGAPRIESGHWAALDVAEQMRREYTPEKRKAANS